MKENNIIANTPTFQYIQLEDCCGCSACSMICPSRIIKMQQDKEGFLYPAVQKNKCVSCGLCVNVCPVITGKEKQNKKQGTLGCFAGSAKKGKAVLEGSSGGVFETLAKIFLASYENAYVVGAVWKKDFTGVEHIIISNVLELEPLKTSKYVQSDKGDVYRQVKELLKEKNHVMFVGAPCEVAGLKNYIRVEEPNLLCVDFLCKGPTSPLFIKDYVKAEEKKKGAHITYLNMRYKWEKLDIWIPQFICIKFSNGKQKLKEFYNTYIGHAFRIVQRNSCYNCKYIGFDKVSDITLADYHGAQRKEEFFNPLGTSLVMVHTAEGSYWVDKIMDLCDFVPVTEEKIQKDNPYIKTGNKKNPMRDEFMEIYQRKGLRKAVLKTTSIKDKLKMVLPWELQRKFIKTNRRK